MIKRFYVAFCMQENKTNSFNVTITSWLPNHTKAYQSACDLAKEKFGDRYSIIYFNYLGWTT